ncbi:DUF6057 family protein [Parabacteroides sp. PF5-6]|uniref:DUF6057 family protein n=1 Tax=Parabacteroides sp. PF5-6 TaxID=1742403 RepID=UPI0024071D15|nr:DUF6057 family protein [Parabacteroides sp. PF5-6]MDF9830553.1 hypothetical protein [Parabacteroides sp. PF5-6]
MSDRKTTHKRRIDYLQGVLFIAGSFLFIQVNYRYWYHFMEQYVLFRTTPFYFFGLLSQPGGFNAYLSEFLMQSFYFPLGAASVIALLFGGVAFLYYLFLRRIQREVSLFGALLPVFLFWLFPVETLAPLLALVFAFSSVLLYTSIPKKNLRYLVGILLIGVNYFLAAPAHLELAILIGIFEWVKGEKGKVWIALVAIGWSVLLPVLAMHTVYVIPLREAYLSKHLYHPEYPIPYAFWLIGLAFPVGAILLYGLRKKAGGGGKVKAVVSTGLLFVCMAIGIGWGKHPMEQAYRYDYYARQGQWQAIVTEAQRTGVHDKDALVYTHLALSRTGQFNEQFLQLPQIGEAGFIPQDPKSRLGLIEAAEVAWQLNHINSAQRFAFVGVLSSQRCIQPRLMMRLVETYLVNEEYKAAEKYITILESAPLYRSWARSQRRFLDPATAAETPWIAERRALRSVTDNNFDLTVNFSNALAFQLDDHPDNRAAFEYAMGYLLVRKDIPTFMHYMELLRDNGKAFPVVYQEAICLFFSTMKSDPEAFRSFPIDKEVYSRFISFVQSAQKVSPAILKQQYGDTYYYYAQFAPTLK